MTPGPRGKQTHDKHMTQQNRIYKCEVFPDFPGGPVAKTLRFQYRGPAV